MPVYRTTIPSLWARIDQSGGADACWPWTGSLGKHGYGQVQYEGRPRTMHRLIWELTNGPIPPGMFVCHSCDNKPCCNPAHLWLGSNAENTADMIAKGRQAKGERSGQSRLTAEQVREIRARHAAGEMGYIRLANEYGVHQQTIAHIIKRRTWLSA